MPARTKRKRSKKGRRNPPKTVWYVLGAVSGYLAAKVVVGYVAYRFARSRPMTCPNCDATVVCEPMLALPNFVKRRIRKRAADKPAVA